MQYSANPPLGRNAYVVTIRVEADMDRMTPTHSHPIADLVV
jgi:hypothetical protein